MMGPWRRCLRSGHIRAMVTSPIHLCLQQPDIAEEVNRWTPECRSWRDIQEMAVQNAEDRDIKKALLILRLAQSWKSPAAMKIADVVRRDVPPRSHPAVATGEYHRGDGGRHLDPRSDPGKIAGDQHRHVRHRHPPRPTLHLRS